jgi:adenine-specific DNA-methyltransferase
MSSHRALGQYFTTHPVLKERVFNFILNKPSKILEPSIGQGDLVSFITDKLPSVKFDMYEIDNKIELLDKIKRSDVIYADFIEQEIVGKYKTIVGNPPYSRTKKGNLYIDFTQKCYNLLEENGELIFIVPSDFFKLTSAAKLLDEMIANGAFTHIFHPHDEKMFENASIDIVIFRYCKNISIEKKVLYNEKQCHIRNNNGLITFGEKEAITSVMFKDFFDIYVGLVSGKEEIYKNKQLGNIEVLNKEDQLDKYIYIENYPCKDEDINEYLSRNKTIMNDNLGEDCIYIYNLTRSTRVSFVSKIVFFGGGLIMLKPKVKCDLHKIASFINSDSFKDNFIFSGRFKIGHRQISNSYIPIEHLQIQ